MKEKSLEKSKNKGRKKQGGFYKFLKWFACLFYRKRKFVGTENIDKNQPVMVIGNHAQLHGPFTCEFYFPFKKSIWCTGEIMDKKEASRYCFEDFWSGKPKRTHWFYKIVAKMIGPLCCYVFSNAETIPVYTDNRVISTFKKTIEALKEGDNIIIYPEGYEPHNNIVNEFRKNFVDVARLYYKATGKEILFVPMYKTPKLKTVCFGTPIKFDASDDIENQKEVICSYIQDEISRLAQELPVHTVVPFANIAKKDYPKSK